MDENSDERTCENLMNAAHLETEVFWFWIYLLKQNKDFKGNCFKTYDFICSTLVSVVYKVYKRN